MLVRRRLSTCLPISLEEPEGVGASIPALEVTVSKQTVTRVLPVRQFAPLGPSECL